MDTKLSQEVMNAIDCGKLIELEGGYMDVNIIRPKFPIKSQHNNQISCSIYDPSIHHGISTFYSFPFISQYLISYFL